MPKTLRDFQEIVDYEAATDHQINLAVYKKSRALHKMLPNYCNDGDFGFEIMSRNKIYIRNRVVMHGNIMSPIEGNKITRAILIVYLQME